MGQNCELAFSLRKFTQQVKAVQFSGLFPSEAATVRGPAIGSRLTCACGKGKRGVPAHWMDPSGVTVDSNQAAGVFYRPVTRRRGTAVNLIVKRKRFFTCVDAGEYTCVIGDSNRTAVLTPISK